MSRNGTNGSREHYHVRRTEERRPDGSFQIGWEVFETRDPKVVVWKYAGTGARDKAQAQADQYEAAQLRVIYGPNDTSGPIGYTLSPEQAASLGLQEDEPAGPAEPTVLPDGPPPGADPDPELDPAWDAPAVAPLRYSGPASVNLVGQTEDRLKWAEADARQKMRDHARYLREQAERIERTVDPQSDVFAAERSTEGRILNTFHILSEMQAHLNLESYLTLGLRIAHLRTQLSERRREEEEVYRNVAPVS